MKMTEQFLSQLEVEAERTRRALERVPEGRQDWKPHDKSMALGRLAILVSGMPGWLAMMPTDQPSMRASAVTMLAPKLGLSSSRSPSSINSSISARMS